MTTTRRPRATCSHCSRDVPLRGDGTAAGHRPPAGGKGWCPGSHRSAAPDRAPQALAWTAIAAVLDPDQTGDEAGLQMVLATNPEDLRAATHVLAVLAASLLWQKRRDGALTHARQTLRDLALIDCDDEPPAVA